MICIQLLVGHWPFSQRHTNNGIKTHNFNIFSLMNYYVLKPAVNTSGTGAAYPQIQKMSPDYNYDSNNSVYAIARCVGMFLDFIPDLNYFVVHNKANLTDLLSNAILPATGLVISKKLKDILQDFNLISNKIYPAKVFHKKEIQEYYYLHVGTTLAEIVNYQKSSFIILLNYAHNIGQINISSFNDYHQKKEKIKVDNPGKTVSIWAEKICFTEDFDQKLDFFKIGIFDTDLYVSEKLKKALIKEKITGLHIELTNKLIL